MKETGILDGVMPSFNCPASAGGGLLTHRLITNETLIIRKRNFRY
jgi:hypothetical protein